MKATNISPENLQIYRQLKQAMSLHLRRQIYVAVCDDIFLRDRLSSNLSSRLTPEQLSPNSLISLDLNLSDPNPWTPIIQWLNKYNISPQNHHDIDLPKFQILGIERLTRQPASVQWLFLSYLRDIEQYLPLLESGLLLWIPRPWLCSIKQSAPEFWRWHTGYFEFGGEPTPAIDFNLPEKDQKIVASSTKSTTNLSSNLSINRLKLPLKNEDKSQLSSQQEKRLNLLSNSLENHSQLNKLIGWLQSKNYVLTHNTNLNKIESIQENSGLQDLVPWQIIAEIEKLSLSKETGEKLGLFYQKLGNYYRDYIGAGDVDNLSFQITIFAYEQALEIYENHQLENLITEILPELGKIYWLWSRQLTTSGQNSDLIRSNLEKSAAYYQAVVGKIDSKTAGELYVKLQKNLGGVYAELSRYQDGPANLQKSILAYQATLLQLEPLRDAEYAAIHNNLGTTYWHLAQYSQPLLHLKQAIESYQEALDYFQQQTDQLAYAMLQNNLGTAYWNLAQYEPSVNLLEKAIESYQEALKYRTAKTAPVACAATQNNLGTAYWHLANQLHDNCQIRTEYLQKAIIAYETALTISQQLNPNQLSFDLWATSNNLGLAHYQLATDPYCQIEADQKIEHLQSGLRYHLQVLQKSQTVPNKSENTTQSNSYQTALSYIIKIVHAFYSIEGIKGQNLALSQIPGQLLPEVLRRL